MILLTDLGLRYFNNVTWPSVSAPITAVYVIILIIILINWLLYCIDFQWLAVMEMLELFGIIVG